MNRRALLTAAALTLVASACRSTEGPPPTPVALADAPERLATGMSFVEGPVWIPSKGYLLFSDIPRSVYMRWSPEGGLVEHGPSEKANGNILDAQGRLVTCRHGARDVVRVEADGTVTVLADRFGGKRFNSPNDLAIEPDGTIWFTDPPWGLNNQRDGKEQRGHYVFRRDGGTGELTLVLEDRAMPNGIALSPDRRTLYVADTGGHPSNPDPAMRDRPATVTAYKVSPAGILATEPRWVIQTPCDGMCVDEGGNLYTTGDIAVHVWSPGGLPVLQIPMTDERPSNVCFGGPDGRTLFMTAQTSLYAMPMNVRGAGL